MSHLFEIFFSYAHEDEELMNEVRRQLIVYERNGQILKWHDRMIPAGSGWRNQIDDRLKRADIILLFMSPHFIESRYCYEVEGQTALEQQNTGKAKVIPVILRPCAWEETPFGEFQALPTDAKPISQWPNCDEASLVTARGIMSAIEEIATAHDEPASIEKHIVKNKEQPSGKSHHVQDNVDENKVVFCKRCGHLVGKQSTCTGTYTHHDFMAGKSNNYCSRCGISPGSQTTCTGTYTHHDFISNDSPSVHCGRCGATIGKQSTCTGTYTHHKFKSL